MSGDIDLTASTTEIFNDNSGVSLVIQGDSHTLDGQGIAGVSPLDIGINTSVGIDGLTITGGNSPILDDGGGLTNFGELTLTNSTVSGNEADDEGGGIANFGTMRIEGSTISGNSSGRNGGGVINEFGTMTILNSTISGNTTVQRGGGVFHRDSSSITIDSTTITGNTSTSGGAFYSEDGTATINNSILANSTSASDCDGDTGVTIAGGHNLIETQSGPCSFVNGTNGNIVGSDPVLGPLADNGGPTFTHALLAGSPAIDAGDTTLTTDQRGEPRSVGVADDIGAFESQTATLTIVKETVGGDGTFEIGSTANSDFVIPPFSLTTVGGTAQQTLSDLNPGYYELAETVQQGWAWSNAVCDADYFFDGSLVQLFDVQAGDDITCTFTNTSVASLTIVKETVGGDGTFEIGSTANSDFVIPPFSLTTVGGTAQQTLSDLNPGYYELAETVQQGWAWSNAVCDADYFFDGSLVQLFDVQAGDDITCTFTNTSVASLTIVKETVGGDDTFEFGSTVNSEFLIPPFSLTTQGGTAQQTLSDLNPGFYEVGEAVPQGWILTNIVCDVLYVFDGNLAKLNLATGDDVTCTFTNVKGPFDLTIVKAAVGGDGTFAFEQTANSDVDFTDFSLTTTGGTAQTTLTDLPAGFLEIEEIVPAGWALTDVECVGVTDDDWGSDFPRARLTASPGDDITCTFTNSNPSVPVTLGWFLAEANGDAVDIRWQTATETANAGFNLYGEIDGARNQLNETLIQSTVIDAVEPTDYAFSAATPATVFYLETVSLDGASELAGPFTLGEEYGVYSAPDGVDVTPRIWLPIMVR